MTASFLLLASIDPQHPVDLGEAGIFKFAQDVMLQVMPPWVAVALTNSPHRKSVEVPPGPLALTVQCASPAEAQAKGTLLHLLATTGWILGFDLSSSKHYVFATEHERAHVAAWWDAVPLLLEPRNALDGDALPRLSSLFAIVGELKRGSSLWRAVDMLGCALGHARQEVRYLLLWTVLEAIFGPASPGDTTHRLAERIARFCATDRDGIIACYKSTLESYSLRSKIVHGLDLKKGDPSTKELEERTREVMLRILESSTLRLVFADKSRDEWLNQAVLVGM